MNDKWKYLAKTPVYRLWWKEMQALKKQQSVISWSSREGFWAATWGFANYNEWKQEGRETGDLRARLSVSPLFTAPFIYQALNQLQVTISRRWFLTLVIIAKLFYNNNKYFKIVCFVSGKFDYVLDLLEIIGCRY